MKKDNSLLPDKEKPSVVFLEHEEIYWDIVEHMNEGVGIADENRIITYANPRLLHMLGYSFDEFIGRDIYSLVNDENLEKMKKQIDGRKKGEAEPYDINLLRKDEQNITVRISPTSIFDKKKNFKGSVSIFTDITDLKRAEKLIQVQRDLGIALGSALELNEVLKMCLDATIKASDMDSGGIYLLNMKTGALELYLHRGLPPAFVNSAQHYEADSPNAQLVMKGAPVYTSYKNLGTPMDEARRNEELKAIAVVPVLHKGSVIACLNIASHLFAEVPVFSRNSIETIVGQIGAVIARMQSELELRQSEEKYRRLVDTMSDGLVIVDKKDVFTYVNRKFCEQLGYKEDEVLGRHLICFFDDENMKIMENQLSLLRMGEEAQYEIKWTRKDGSSIDTLVSPRPLFDSDNKYQGSFAVITDVSDLKRAEMKVRNSLAEKEILIKEIHHRVKNNMQVISSLLSLQADYVKYDEDKVLFDESCNRIRSMATVHEKLYRSQNLSEIDFGDYLRELVNDLSQNYIEKSRDIEITFGLDSISLGVDFAIPCALIVNELITNTFKYAFPGEKKGTLKISCKNKEGIIRLVISDNGIGLSDGITVEKSETLGLKIVNALCSQITSTLTYDGSQGAKFTMEFKV